MGTGENMNTQHLASPLGATFGHTLPPWHEVSRPASGVVCIPKEAGKSIFCVQKTARICTDLGGKSPPLAQSPSTILTPSEMRQVSEYR